MLKEAEFDGADEAVKADCLQRYIEGACESTLRKVCSAPNRKFCNYWWSEKIAELRGQALKALRKLTRERQRGASRAERLLAWCIREQEGSCRRRSRKARGEHGLGFVGFWIVIRGVSLTVW
jgi:hypothetical protein